MYRSKKRGNHKGTQWQRLTKQKSSKDLRTASTWNKHIRTPFNACFSCQNIHLIHRFLGISFPTHFEFFLECWPNKLAHDKAILPVQWQQWYWHHVVDTTLTYSQYYVAAIFCHADTVLTRQGPRLTKNQQVGRGTWISVDRLDICQKIQLRQFLWQIFTPKTRNLWHLLIYNKSVKIYMKCWNSVETNVDKVSIVDSVANVYNVNYNVNWLCWQCRQYWKW